MKSYFKYWRKFTDNIILRPNNNGSLINKMSNSPLNCLLFTVKTLKHRFLIDS